MDKNRVKNIFQVLRNAYPHAKIVLNYSNNWELLVSVILSAQCTDKKVNEVTAKLFKKYQSSSLRAPPKAGRGNLLKPDRHGSSGLAMTKEIQHFANVPLGELEQDVKPTGFYRNKAKNIQAAAKIILKKFGAELPRTMDEMVTIPGVARKTANVVLGNAYGIVEGIAVDTHVLRISQRLRLVELNKVGPNKKPIYFNSLNRFRISEADSGMTENKSRTAVDYYVDYYKDANPEKIEQALMNIIPKKDWFPLTYLLINHGRATCKAQKPRCGRCPLRVLCPVSRS